MNESSMVRPGGSALLKAARPIRRWKKGRTDERDCLLPLLLKWSNVILMAPKQSKGKGKEKAENVENVRCFYPSSVPTNCRFVLNLPSTIMLGFEKEFWELILNLRYNCSGNGKKCNLLEWVYKLMCREDVDYDDSRFFILTLAIDKQFKIDVLVYRPNIYMVAVCVEEKWWRVRDFMKVTKFDFPHSGELPYNSAYHGIPSIFSYYIFRDSIIQIFKGKDSEMKDTELYFKRLCVIISESIRFNSILIFIAASFVQSKSKTLPEFELWLINNWGTVSTLWLLYDLGYVWDPMKVLKSEDPEDSILEFQIDDPKKAEKAIGILKHPSNLDFLKDIESIWKAELNASTEIKLRARPMGPLDMEVLDDIRCRCIREKVEEEKKPSNIIEVKKHMLIATEFVDHMRKKYVGSENR